METIEIRLNTQTLARTKQLAAHRKCSLEKLVEEAIEKLSTTEAIDMDVTKTEDDLIIGLFADEPELMEEVLEDIMNSRKTYKLRATDG